MSDISRSRESTTASEDTTSNRVISNAGGNALLDAENSLSGQPSIDRSLKIIRRQRCAKKTQHLRVYCT